MNKTKVSFSFDDGETLSILGKPFTYWNDKILSTLDFFDLKSMFFVVGKFMNNLEGAEILRSWDNRGHAIANHTYHHLDYHSNIDKHCYYADIIKNEKFLSSYANFTKYYRSPYLHGGDTWVKKRALENFLKSNGYKRGYVTIDASDWYINERFQNALSKCEDSVKCIDLYRNIYINHIMDRAIFYDDLAQKTFSHPVRHILLLHHNLAAGFFLKDLMRSFIDHRWELINIDEAYEAGGYFTENISPPLVNSLIWLKAREQGIKKSLRDPGESWIYEKEKIDNLEKEILLKNGQKAI